MEEKGQIKISLKVLVICIFIIILLVIALVITYYLGFVKNQNNQSVSYIPESISIDSQKDVGNGITKEKSYSNFKVAKSDDEKITYIIAQDANNNWCELAENNQDIELFGEYDGKLYFSDWDGINYIDLNNENLTQARWLTFERYLSTAETTEEDTLMIGQADMIDDTIYFNYGSFGGGNEPTDGVLTLKVTDNSLDDAKQLVADADSWHLDVKNRLLYYLEFGYGANEDLYRMDLKTNSKEKILSNVESFEIKDDKILCTIINQTTTPDENGYYPATYELYLYDLNTKKNTLINSSSDFSIGAFVQTHAEYINNDVYYQINNSIIKYNNGKKDVIYTWSPSDGGEYLYGFTFVDNNIIELILQQSKHKYLIDGKVVENPANIPTYTVKMLNGETMNFTVIDFKK